MLTVANEATLAVLDVDVRLDSRAAKNIVAARPIESLQELDDIAYVAATALDKILAYAEIKGHVQACQAPSACNESASLRVANELTLEQLDDLVGLDSRAAKNIVAARPLATFDALDDVGYVASSALGKLLAYAEANGYVAACTAGGTELGIVSDLDKTVIPPGDPDLSEAPYPGVSTLYQILERRNDGQDGDMHYVTARQPDMITDVPDYLEQYGVPSGSIDTGISGLPWIAEDEKVSDVSGVLDAAGTQRFVLFGDSSHVDPAVYQRIRELYGDRIIAGFIHKVNVTVSPDRVIGLHLHESYAEVAAILYGYEVLTREQARSVMTAAQSEGLAITDSEMDDLLEQNAP